MTIWIDPPSWPAHGRLWSHLVSDNSYAELHEFATAAGVPRRTFEGDHYDVPQERYAALVACGARPVAGRELLQVLVTSGLRMPKRRSDKGVARVTGVPLPGGSTADVDLLLSANPAAGGRVFAAMTFVQEAGGRHAVVYSHRRDEWGAPGGWREPGESVLDTAVREVEESGLRVDPVALRACGYVRFAGSWSLTGQPSAPGRDLLQVFRTSLPQAAPALHGALESRPDWRWVSSDGFQELCGRSFWWPLAERALSDSAGAARE